MKVSCYDDEVNTVVLSLHLISVYGKVSAAAVGIFERYCNGGLWGVTEISRRGPAVT